MSNTPIEIVPIKEVFAHPNADRLEIVKVLNTQFVSQKGEFIPGALCVYFPPEMLIPEKVAERLGVKQYLKHAVIPGDLLKSQCRISAIRLRSIPSYGFGLALKKVSDFFPEEPNVGDDVTDVFYGVKYQLPPMIAAGNTMRSPPEFHTYTNIQHYYRYADALTEGTLVRITEKIHGCLVNSQRITMADESKKKVSLLEIGDEVLGIDEESQLCTAFVTQIFRNGSAYQWLNIRTTRTNIGRGNSFGSVQCTPEHKFYSPACNDYVEAGNLKIGDKILMVRSNLQLSSIAYQILLGKMLGGYGSKIYRANIIQCNSIKVAFEDFFSKGRKQLPKWVIEKITPLALAFWYMDDGSLSHCKDQEDRAIFNSCGFTEIEHDILLEALAKFNINGIKFQSEGHWRIRLNADNAEKLFLLIAPYIPSELQYKLPKRYRGHKGWLPEIDSQYKPKLVEQTIVSINDVTDKIQSQRFDIETTTHNYFASDILVHNSNSRVGYVRTGNFAASDNGYEIVAGTRYKRCAKENLQGKVSLYWTPLQNDNLEDMLLYISENYNNANVVIFGEIFGNKVQKMDYGVPHARGYRVFDISVDGEYLGWNQVLGFCRAYDILTVPLLYKGPFSDDLIEKFVSGPTLLCNPDKIHCSFKGREGIVVTPLYEAHSEMLQGRLILKSVNSDYYQAMK